MLSAGFNIVGFSWLTSPAATELEMIVLDWLAKMLKLPDDFHSAGKVMADGCCGTELSRKYPFFLLQLIV